MRGDREHLLSESMADAYIAKPFTPEEILGAVRTLIGARADGPTGSVARAT